MSNHEDHTIWCRCHSGEYVKLSVWDDSSHFLTHYTKYSEYGWRRKVKAIWAILCGQEYPTQEIVLYNEDLEELKKFIKAKGL